ncbi:MAG: ThuA domain-containing protein [Planctomycetia bacterium]|nr:ThuA domain-containing protein [Planctomycetia bacterium]
MFRRCVAVAALAALLLATPGTAAEKKQLLLLGQKRDNHPPTTHEFMAGLRVLARCLEPISSVEVRAVEVEEPWPEGPDLIRRADGVVLYLSEGAKWLEADPRRLDAVAQLAARGGGLSALHWGIGAKEARHVESFVKLFGGCHGGPDRRYQVVETELQVADGQHPVARGLAPLTVRDEFYYRLKAPAGEPAPRTLLTATIDGQAQRVAWTWERADGGRSFGYSGLHFHDNWRHEFYRRLATQGVLWTLKLDIPAAGVPVDVEDEVLKLK